MTSAEWVSTWSMEDEQDKKQNRPVGELIKALQQYLETTPAGRNEMVERIGLNPCMKWDDPGRRIPKRFHQLIAYAVEGGSEGWYVHVGALVPLGGDDRTLLQGYLDFGFCKNWDAEAAHDLAREAQRFLNAIRWN